jgi:hypothetical protein
MIFDHTIEQDLAAKVHEPARFRIRPRNINRVIRPLFGKARQRAAGECDAAGGFLRGVAHAFNPLSAANADVKVAMSLASAPSA